jgi:hypothetical protein
MDSQHDDPAIRTHPQAASGAAPPLPLDPQERADLQEDLRRQREQDWAELGGEA